MPGQLARGEIAERARALAAQTWSRRLVWLYALSEVGLVGFGIVLLLSGYPPARAAVALGVGLAWAIAHAAELRARSASTAQAAARRADGTLWWMLGSGFGVVAATGGLGSPLLPGAVAALPLYLFQDGWSARTRLRWAATGLGVLLVAAAPDAWAGPPPGPAVYWTVAVGNVLLVLGATVFYLGLLTRLAHDSVREARRAREELALQAIARARELEQLGAQLSHELRNPLSAIKTLVQLSTRAVQDAESRERLEVVEGEIQRMQQVLQDYLSFSRPLERLEPQELRLGAVVEDVLALLAGRAAEAGVALRTRGEALVRADPLRLREALLNLLVNALEASPRGGRVEVAVEEEAGTARISVTDAGRGMSAEVLARIGTPFFTTREDGTGLGVALARATFVRHGGALTYESRPGAGTTATATLPAVALRRADAARARGG